MLGSRKRRGRPEIYGRYPRQVVTDGGFVSEDNLFDAKDLGVKVAGDSDRFLDRSPNQTEW
jgi:hypothetical protein